VCQPQEVIDKYLSQTVMSFGFVNTMFVPNDYSENPFQTFLDDRMFIYIDPWT